jgi:hypothetical protein
MSLQQERYAKRLKTTIVPTVPILDVYMLFYGIEFVLANDPCGVTIGTIEETASSTVSKGNSSTIRAKFQKKRSIGGSNLRYEVLCSLADTVEITAI